MIQKAKSTLEISDSNHRFIRHDILHAAFEVFAGCVNLSEAVFVSLLFCEESEMQKINGRYRGVDKTTDVLSFSADSVNIVNPDYNNEPQYIGEILIDTNYIRNHKDTDTFDNAVIRVFIHGLLHLIGYDHLNTRQKDEMEKMEKTIMNKIDTEGKRSG